MALPPGLDAALERLLYEKNPADLALRALRLSDQYRKGQATRVHDAALDPDDALAYAAARLPATYGALASVLNQVHAAAPDFSPRSVLDVGAGPGTGLWAAVEEFPDIQEISGLEREDAMRALAQTLLKGAVHPALRDTDWTTADILAAPLRAHDLVTASYVLGELAEALDAVTEKLWQAARQVLVVLEPGTPEGFRRIRQVRDRLIQLGGSVLAPCPHDGRCPIADADWCHFSERIPRSRRHRQLKGGVVPYEDEKFSYVAVSRSPISGRPGRILRHPEVRPGWIRLDVCDGDGISSVSVTRSDQAVFRRARKAKWGERWPSSRSE